jgi:hypothetical protein
MHQEMICSCGVYTLVPHNGKILFLCLASKSFEAIALFVIGMQIVRITP